MFVQQGPKLFFERHLAMMNFLPRNRRDNRLAHLAPFQGDLWETFSPGLKPRAESRPQRFRVANAGWASCPFGVEKPLQKTLK
jgi:hypothetical protein